MTLPVLYQDLLSIWIIISCRLLKIEYIAKLKKRHLPISLSVGLPSGVVGIIISTHCDTLLKIHLFIFMHKYGQRQIGTTILVQALYLCLQLTDFLNLSLLGHLTAVSWKILDLSQKCTYNFFWAINGWLKLYVNEIFGDNLCLCLILHWYIST